MKHDIGHDAFGDDLGVLIDAASERMKAIETAGRSLQHEGYLIDCLAKQIRETNSKRVDLMFSMLAPLPTPALIEDRSKKEAAVTGYVAAVKETLREKFSKSAKVGAA